MKQPRKYQLESIDSIFSSLSAGISKQLLVICTGGGKTYTAVKTAAEFKKTLFIVDSEELLEQAALAFLKEKFDDEFCKSVEDVGFLNYVKNPHYFAGKPFKMGAIKQEIFDVNGDVVVASIQTLHRRLDRLYPEMFDCVIVDEAHCYMAKTFFKGVDFFTPKLRLGLTATPHRADNLPLGDLFDKIVYEYNIADGIRDGYLVELDALKVSTTVSLDKVRTTAGELNQQDLSNEINTLARNNLIAEKWIQHAKGRPTIAFCCNIQHALDLCDVFLNRGIKATAISSDEELTGDRSQKVKDFKAGKYEVIFNVNILTKGFDHPAVGCILAAAPTKSLTRYIQMVGRGTRTLPGVIDGLETHQERWKAIKASGKKDCLIIDIVDVTTRHNIVNAWTLDRELPPEERVFTTQEKKDKLIASRLAKLEHKREKDERVSLLKIPKVKISKSIRMQDKATDAQLKWIKDLGYDTDTVHYTKEMCVKIINDLPATQAQVNMLKALKYDVSGRVITRGDVNAVMKEVEERKRKEEERKKQNNKQTNNDLF